MGLLVLSFKITDKGVIQSLGAKNIREAAKTALLFAGNFWLSNIMPKHFQPGIQNRYTFDPRTEVYMKVLKRMFGKGDGVSAKLQLRGRTFRFAKFFSKVTGTSNRAVVRMNLPAYFVNPKTGVVNEGGKRKNIRRMPRMAMELTQTSAEDTTLIDQRATEIYKQFFSRSNSGSSVPLPPVQSVTVTIQ